MHQNIQSPDQENNQQPQVIQQKQPGTKTPQSEAQQTKQGNQPAYQSPQSNATPVQTKQSGLSPYVTKEGQKGPIQAAQSRIEAKQRPVQRNGKQGQSGGKQSQSSDLKGIMGNQYGVDLSGYKEHKDSTFPGSVGALATIQGKDIHYAPGQFTEKNRKHELGHAIDNTMNGTPKGDTTIQGHAIDTTREAAADKIMNTPLQRKADNSQMLQPASSSGGTIQRVTNPRALEIAEALLSGKYQNARITAEELRERFMRHVNGSSRQLPDFSESDTRRFMMRELGPLSKSLGKQKADADRRAERSDKLNRRDADGYAQTGKAGAVSGKTAKERAQYSEEEMAKMTADETVDMKKGAPAAKEEFDAALDKIAVSLSAKRPEIKKGPLKEDDRINAKAHEKYDHNPRRLTDIVRATLVFKSLGDLIDSVTDLESKFQMDRIKNGIGGKKGGYQDMKLNIRLPKSEFIAELQLHVSQLTKAKDEGGGHEIYEVERLKKGTIELEEKKIGKMLARLEKVRRTVREKADGGEHPELDEEKIAEYNELLDRVRVQAQSGTIHPMLDGKDQQMFKELGKLIYEDANREVTEAMGSEKVRQGIERINEKAEHIKERKEQAIANVKASRRKPAKPKPAKRKKGAKLTQFDHGSVVTDTYGQRYRVTNVSGDRNNCLIQAIAKGLGIRLNEDIAQEIREEMGITDGDFLANDDGIVEAISRRFSHNIIIYWYEQSADFEQRVQTGSPAQSYGLEDDPLAELHIVLSGGDHFQVLRPQF